VKIDVWLAVIGILVAVWKVEIKYKQVTKVSSGTIDYLKYKHTTAKNELYIDLM
jgi:hypothetical protein